MNNNSNLEENVQVETKNRAVKKDVLINNSENSDPKVVYLENYLPKYDKYGYEYKYYAVEDKVPTGFKWLEQNKNNSLTVTNELIPETKPTPVPTPTPSPSINKFTLDRVSGKDRIETAVNISKKYYKSAKTVIVVRDDLYPDSLTATVLAKQLNAPILLTKTNSLDLRVKEEIKRLGAKEVIIVGGEGTISKSLEKSLRLLSRELQVTIDMKLQLT